MRPITPLAALAVIVSFFVSNQLLASPSQDAAFDERGGAVVDSQGDCVRTKWMGSNDPCSPKTVEKAKEPTPTVYLSKSERTIYFDFNKASILDTEKAKLQYIARLINSSTAIRSIHVVGYTDQFGTDSYNQKLSEKRVDAVKEFLGSLIRTNVKPQSMEMRGAGKAPETGCKDIKKRAERIECMREQRRVEVVLNYQFQE